MQFNSTFHGSMIGIFQMKNYDSFPIYSYDLNIDFGHILQLTQCVYVLRKVRKQTYTPTNPTFPYIMWAFRGGAHFKDLLT